MPILARVGSTVLRDYNPHNPSAPAMLVVPSLINRFDILDLDHGWSFLRALAAQGYRPLLVDWGAPTPDERDLNLSDYIRRLMRLMESVTTPRLHLLGYCMGGLLALALAQLCPARIATLTLMATPWDFHQPDPSVATGFASLGERIEPQLAMLGHLPVDVIQSLFASLQPLQVMQKFTRFAAQDPTSIAARHFVLLEDWLNDGVPLTAATARECFRDWYGANAPARGEWRVDGTVIDPRCLSLPSYIMVPGRDRIVPPESARPLATLIPNATLHEPPTGHIGLIASHTAPTAIWPQWFRWLGRVRSVV